LFNFRSQEFVESHVAVIKALFCSDPKYRRLYWDWGGLNLTEGKKQRPILNFAPRVKL
jgi:hypothetical protein